MKKAIAWIAFALLLFHIASDPGGAAGAARGLGGGLYAVFSNVVTFFRELSN